MFLNLGLRRYCMIKTLLLTSNQLFQPNILTTHVVTENWTWKVRENKDKKGISELVEIFLL